MMLHIYILFMSIIDLNIKFLDINNVLIIHGDLI